MANPFLSLFPTEEAAKNAKDARDRQQQGMQATLKRIFLITGESKQLNKNNLLYCANPTRREQRRPMKHTLLGSWST